MDATAALPRATVSADGNAERLPRSGGRARTRRGLSPVPFRAGAANPQLLSAVLATCQACARTAADPPMPSDVTDGGLWLFLR